PLDFSERRLLLILLDLCALNGALLFSLSLRKEYSLTWDIVWQHPHWFFLLSFLWLFIAFAFDAYDMKVAGDFLSITKTTVKAGLVASLIYLLIPYISPALPSSRFFLFLFLIFIIGFLLAGRYFYLLIFSQPFFNWRSLIIGTGPRAQMISRVIKENTNGQFHVVGFVQEMEKAESKNPDGEVLGNSKDLINLIKKYQINTVILAGEQNANGEMLQILTDALELGIEIIPMPILYEGLTGCVPVDHIGGSWQVAMPIDHPLTNPFNRFIKRVSDIILAFLGCLCLAPFFPFIALAIYIESPGPIFYTQTRVGRGGKIFRAYKFRSMIPDAEKDRPVWADKNDPRVTRVGRILRKTHVDEFPQFWNILKGEMSAVGPRPERPEFVEELAREIPFYRVRHAVKPGMAGWGLVKYGYASSKEDSIIKLQYDLYYIKHWSLWFDLIILLKTIIDTLTFRGRA
ncbi:MAG: sugar transferase, partial [bacterium]